MKPTNVCMYVYASLYVATYVAISELFPTWPMQLRITTDYHELHQQTM